MHIVEGLTGVSSKKNIEVRKGFSHLLIVKNGNANGIVNEIINVTIKGLANELNLIPNRKVSDVAILSQYGSGYLLREVLAGGNIKSAYQIQVGANVGLSLGGQNEYVQIDLEGLDSTATYDVYGVEHLQAVRGGTRYQSEIIAGSDATQRVFSLEGVAMFAIKDNGALKSVTLRGVNGVQVSYKPEELKAASRQNNGTAIGPDTLIEGDSINQTVNGGAVSFFFIPSVNYSQIEVYTTGVAEMNILKTSLVGY